MGMAPSQGLGSWAEKGKKENARRAQEFLSAKMQAGSLTLRLRGSPCCEVDHTHRT